MHPARSLPLVWLSLTFLVGILLGERFSGFLDGKSWVWVTFAGLFLALVLFPRWLKNKIPAFASLRLPLPNWPAPVSLPWLMLVLGAGALRFQSIQPEFNPTYIGWYAGREEIYVVEGVLQSPPDERDTHTQLSVAALRLHRKQETRFTPVQGMILALVPAGDNWRYGDLVRLEGQIAIPPENEEFSYRDYLSRQGIHAYLPNGQARLLGHGYGNTLKGGIYALRRRFLNTVYQLWPDPEASLLAGILLGVESGIPQPVEEAFKDTGTSHIIAISGFNITLLSGLMVTLFGRLLGKKRRVLAGVLSAAGIAVYTLLVGADAAVVRAALMGGLALFARMVGRRQDGLNSLAFVAALMALFDPNVLWDIGFQLSFMATLGLVLYAEPLSDAFVARVARWLPLETAQRLAGPVGEYVLFTLAAQITTLPVMVYHFQRLSLSAFLTNPVILPAQPPVMILGGLAVFLAQVSAPLGQLAAQVAWPFVAFTIRAVELFAAIPGGVLVLGQVSLLVVVLYYAALLAGFLDWREIANRLSGGRLGQSSDLQSSSLAGFVVAGMGIAAVLAWRAALSSPDGLLHVSVLDVGSGEAILIRTPSGRNVLLGGGPSPSALGNALGRRLPLGYRRLDWLVVGGVEERHIGALPASLERFPPERVLWSGPPLGTVSARRLQQELGRMSVPIYNAQTGQVLDLGAGAQLHVLAVTSRGAVFLLEYDSFRVLLPIGIDFEQLESLGRDARLSQLTALLLTGSGYAPLNPPEWIDRLQPQLVLLSVGAGDKNGLPDPETLQAVQGLNLLRTDRNGWIHLSTDGEQLRVEVERK
ncbi:MAG: ComEC/Rec2 family competence protein [Anaerolineales bacterium]